MQDRWLRLRSLLDNQYTVLVVSLLALALVGGWLTYGAHVEPGTTTMERTVSSWSMTGAYNHSATVTEENPVEPVGATLTGRSTYLTSVSPVATGAFSFRYTARGNGDLDITIEERSVVRSIETGEDSSAEMWRDARTLETRSQSSVSPGEAVTVPFSVDAPQAKNRTAQIEEALGNPPGDPQFSIVTTVSVTGTVNGQAVDRTTEYVLPVTFVNGAYRLNATTETREFGATETITVPQRPGPLESIGGPLLLACSLGGLAGLVWKGDDLSLSDAERDRLRFQDDRETMDEWINEMRLPDEIRERQQIDAASLADLVDFAIDTNNSVIKDEGYHVLHDGMLYTYEPPESVMSLPEGRPAENATALSDSSAPTDGEITDSSDD